MGAAAGTGRDPAGALASALYRFTEEPKRLSFFFGKLATTSPWQEKVVARFREDLGDSL